MKPMKFLMNILVMTVATLSLASCSDDNDGDWDSMVWKAETPVQKNDGVYTVSEEGTTLTFYCKNYSDPWIEYAKCNGEYYYPPHEVNDYFTITADWFKAELNGNKLTVVFEANETKEERPLQLSVTAGDIFYTFKFKQEANK